MPSIFIAYRQDDAKPWALMLRDALAGAFGAEQVFLDKDTLHAGSWLAQIRQALAQSKVALVVIGRRWLTVTDPQGRRRLEDPQDVHRQELALALASPGLTVIPVLVDGATMPRAEELGEDIRALAAQQAQPVADAKEHRDIDLRRLVGEIERATGLQAARRDVAPQAGAFTRRARLLAVAAAASVVVLVMCELGLGWRLGAEERSFIVLVVAGLTVVGAALQRRLRSKGR